MPARTGAEYIAGIRDRAAEVYIGGERVKDVTSHPAFAGGLRTVAGLLDMQHEPALHDEMTYTSPSTGDPVGLSFIMPRDAEDLARRRNMMRNWAKLSCGMMGRTPDFLNVAVIRSMAGRWSDEHIAASLNRMGMRTGQDKSWTAKRVGSIRRVNGIDGYLSADKQGNWRTMSEAANELGTTSHTLRHLIEDGTLPATQLVPGAPWQIRAADLHSEVVVTALARRKGPCRASSADQMSIFSDT